MTRRVVHQQTRVQCGNGNYWSVACGPIVHAVNATNDPAEVTCGNCKRTRLYREMTKESNHEH